MSNYLGSQTICPLDAGQTLTSEWVRLGPENLSVPGVEQVFLVWDYTAGDESIGAEIKLDWLNSSESEVGQTEIVLVESGTGTMEVAEKTIKILKGSAGRKMFPFAPSGRRWANVFVRALGEGSAFGKIGMIAEFYRGEAGKDAPVVKKNSEGESGGGGYVSDELKGTKQYGLAGGEQTIMELITSTRKLVHGFWLDLTNMGPSGEVKVYYKVDGSTYRTVMSRTWDAAVHTAGLYVSLNMGIADDLKVTFEEGSIGGMNRNIPYSMVYEVIES